MAKLNLSKAMRFMEKGLTKVWGKIKFTYTTVSSDEIKATADVTLGQFDDSIAVVINGYKGGGAQFRAVFDKLDKNSQTLALIHDFNQDNIFFKAYIRNDGYLELYNFIVCFDEGIYKDYPSEFMYRLCNLADNAILKQLVALTHA